MLYFIIIIFFLFEIIVVVVVWIWHQRLDYWQWKKILNREIQTQALVVKYFLH